MSTAATVAACAAMIVTASACGSAGSAASADHGSTSSDSASGEATGQDAAGQAILASGEVGAGSLTDELRGRTFLSTSVTGYELVADSTIAATFTAEGTISLNAGCNTLFGPVDITDGHLSSSMLASTMMACDEALMKQDTWLSGLIEGGMDAALAGGTLTLTAGDVVIELAQQDTPMGADGVGDLEEPSPGDGEIPANPGD